MLCCFFEATHAQTAAPSMYTVSGTVVADSGRAATSVRIMFIDSSNYSRDVIATATGGFSIMLPVGTYKIRIEAVGYPIQYFNGSVNSDLPIFRLSVLADKSLSITLTKTPQKAFPSYGTVSGIVLDSVGRPLVGAAVELFMLSYNDVSAVLQTDNTGYFSATVPALTHNMSVVWGGYPKQYWTPGGTSISATPNTVFQVLPNDTVRLTMKLTQYPGNGTPVYPPVYNNGYITGKVLVKASNLPATGMIVYAFPQDSSFLKTTIFPDLMTTPYSDTVHADGSYTIKNLSLGSYLVFCRGGIYMTQFFPQTDNSTNAALIRVDSTGRVGIDFFVRPAGAIEGQVSSVQTNLNLDGIIVYANQVETNKQLSATTSLGGKFKITGCATGRWSLAVNGDRGFFIDYTKGTQDYYVTEGMTVTGANVPLLRGGSITGQVMAPQDTNATSSFNIALFPDSVLSASNPYPYETQSVWCYQKNASQFTSSVCQPGTYRCIAEPQMPYISRYGSWGPVPCWSYSMGAVGPIQSIRQVAPITIVAGDTAQNASFLFTKGFSFLSWFSVEDKSVTPPTWAHVDACIKDGSSYIPISHGYITSGDSMFQLAGLVDGQDYFLRADAEGYPTQWWGSGNVMSSDPSSPYHFSVSQFTMPKIKMLRVPSGFKSNYIPLSITTTMDSLKNLVVSWNADVSMKVDTFFLYSKDRNGLVKMVLSLPFDPTTQKYSWRELRDLSINQYSYIVVGKGKTYTIRSSVAGYDFSSFNQPAQDSLYFSVYGDHHGISMNWSAGKSYVASDKDTVSLYKLGDAGVWAVLMKQPASNTWISDNKWDKVKDAGKTFSYKIELGSNGIAKKVSGVRSFTLDNTFVSSLSNSYSVGPSETYKKIQDAVNAANDFDDIEIMPGTYFENIDCKGKVLSFNGQWNNGVAPVIDANGGTAFKVPFCAKGGINDNVSISGLKIQNALVGVNSSATINLNQCLFVNIVKQILTASIDTAAMMTAAQKDPFNGYDVQLNAWQCTFIGSKGTVALAHVGSQGSYENPAAGATLTGYEPYFLSPASLFSSHVKCDNSIIVDFAMPQIPLDIGGKYGGGYFGNCDFYNASIMVPSTMTAQVDFNGQQYSLDPMFTDNINYFLPDSSALRTISGNTTIGYDQRRLYNTNGSGQNTIRLPAVPNIHVTVSPPRSVTLRWDRLSADQPVKDYVVFRVHGFDSLFFVNNQQQWEPKVSNDSLYTILDTFVTKDSIYTDTTPLFGFPYIYVVAARSQDNEIGEVNIPFPPPLSSYIVRLQATPSVQAVRKSILSFTAVSLEWPPVPSATYSVYKIGLDAATIGTEPDSAKIRQILKTKSYVSLDSIATRDTVMIDSSLLFNRPYCFVVVAKTPSASQVSLDQVQLSSSFVWINKETFSGQKSVRLTGKTWNMIGPWGSGSLDFSAATDVAIYHWDDARQADKLYSQYASGFEMKTGKAYWYQNDRDTVISVDTAIVNALSPQTAQFLSLTKVNTGWNQVASSLPYPVSPPWLQSTIAYEWNPDSNQYAMATIIKPWKGYWIFSEKDTLLPLCGFPQKNSLAKKMMNSKWELRVSLVGKKSNDPDNFCGQVAPTSAKSSAVANLKPPYAFDYPQLFFVDNQENGQQIRLSKQYKSPVSQSDKCEFMVGVSPSTEPMTIAFDNIASVPKKSCVFFIQNGTMYNLRSNNSIPVAVHKEAVFGYIVVTSNPKDIALYEGTVELRRAYPNPFTRSAHIEFTVPYAFAANGAKIEGETRNINLDIYNLTGKRIASVIHGQLPVGYYNQAWMGMNDAGKPVSNGYYIVRLSGRDFQKTTPLFKVR